MKNDISKEMYIELIDTFMPLECMKEYMKGEGSIINNERLLSELIIYSSVALQTKREWLDKLRVFCANVSDGLFEEAYTAVNKAWVELTKVFSKHLPYSQCKEQVEKLGKLSNKYF